MQSYHLQNRPEREIIQDTQIREILKNGKFVVISMCRENEPYIVTLSYGYDGEKNSLYFHSSNKGLKLAFIEANPAVCATIIEDGGYAKDECAHNYRSVVFWGNLSIVHEPEEKKHGMTILLNHLESDSTVIREKIIKSDAAYSTMAVLRLDILQIHGKAGR
jgi:nitroimidazol reductase NimA-like FMN-containing flavoprotein (pyridoxamine 5'-phosphate oxidase superfamily)